MSALTSRQILDAFDDALEISSRWPRLLLALELAGRPGARMFNDALQARGFQPVVDEDLALRTMLQDYPDAWWFAIALEVTGHRDATVQQVVDALKARSSRHAAQ